MIWALQIRLVELKWLLSQPRFFTSHSHIATDSLSSLHQIRKHLLYPELHCHHVHGDILKIPDRYSCKLPATHQTLCTSLKSNLTLVFLALVGCSVTL